MFFLRNPETPATTISRFALASNVLVLITSVLLAGSLAHAHKAPFIPQSAEYSAATLLAAAQQALTNLSSSTSDMERGIQFAAAISALTGLYQLHGCEWAAQQLSYLYRQPDCPELRIGFSQDGRLSLRLVPLELKRPELASYTVLLCTVTSNTALDLRANSTAPLEIELLDGSRLTAQALVPSHPLWPALSRLTPTFEPINVLPSGTGIAYKQLFATPNLDAQRILAVYSVWGEYVITIPWFTGEVESD